MFKNCNQFNLIPQDYKEFLGEGHEVMILEEIINELDLTEIIASYSNSLRGTPAYHPRMLLKVLFYGYMNQTFSSRKLAKKLKSDLAFMYLAGNNQADFRTINNFRKNKGGMLEGLFVQIVLKAKELGLISFGITSVDGTKVYANASKNKNNDIESLDKKISKLFEEADKIDKLEDKEFGEDNENEIPEELRTKEGRDKKRKEIKEKKKKLEDKKEIVKREIESKKEAGINQERINETDVDSRLMMMKKKDWGNGYNPQNLTENQFILVTTVPNRSNDTNELIPLLKKFEEKYKSVPKKVLADKGYGTEENYKYGEEKKIETYIPHPKQSGASLDDYIYNKKADIYEDKEGNIFKLKQYVGSLTGRKRGRPKKGEIMREKDFEAKLYMSILKDGTKKYLQIAKHLKTIFKKNDERLYSEEGKKIYKKKKLMCRGCPKNLSKFAWIFWTASFVTFFFKYLYLKLILKLTNLYMSTSNFCVLLVFKYYDNY